MIKFKLWDKKEPINGVDAKKVIEQMPSFGVPDNRVYLIYDGVSGRILRNEEAHIIRGNAMQIEKDGTVYNTRDLNDEEIMQLLCDVMNGVASYYQEPTPPTAEERIAAAMEYQNIMNY